MTGDQERAALAGRILEMHLSLAATLAASRPEQWAGLDLTMPQLKVLLLAHAADGAASMGAVSKQLGVHVSTVTGIVDRLEERALVQRQTAPEDRRVVLVQLTPAGRAALQRVYASGRATLSERLRGLTLEELQQVGNGLEILQRALGPCP